MIVQSRDQSKEISLIRKLLLLAVLLPFSALVMHGTASAAPSYSTKSLSALMLTPKDLSSVFNGAAYKAQYDKLP